MHACYDNRVALLLLPYPGSGNSVHSHKKKEMCKKCKRNVCMLRNPVPFFFACSFCLPKPLGNYLNKFYVDAGDMRKHTHTGISCYILAALVSVSYTLGRKNKKKSPSSRRGGFHHSTHSLPFDSDSGCGLSAQEIMPGARLVNQRYDKSPPRERST